MPPARRKSDRSRSQRNRSSHDDHLKPKRTRTKGGCLTCRIRGKKCDGQMDNHGSSCATCARLHICCLAPIEKRPEWIRRNLPTIKARITNFLVSQGSVKGHPLTQATALAAHANPNSLHHPNSHISHTNNPNTTHHNAAANGLNNNTHNPNSGVKEEDAEYKIPHLSEQELMRDLTDPETGEAITLTTHPLIKVEPVSTITTSPRGSFSSSRSGSGSGSGLGSGSRSSTSPESSDDEDETYPSPAPATYAAQLAPIASPSVPTVPAPAAAANANTTSPTTSMQTPSILTSGGGGGGGEPLLGVDSPMYPPFAVSCERDEPSSLYSPPQIYTAQVGAPLWPDFSFADPTCAGAGFSSGGGASWSDVSSTGRLSPILPHSPLYREYLLDSRGFLDKGFLDPGGGFFDHKINKGCLASNGGFLAPPLASLATPATTPSPRPIPGLLQKEDGFYGRMDYTCFDHTALPTSAITTTTATYSDDSSLLLATTTRAPMLYTMNEYHRQYYLYPLSLLAIVSGSTSSPGAGAVKDGVVVTVVHTGGCMFVGVVVPGVIVVSRWPD